MKFINSFSSLDADQSILQKIRIITDLQPNAIALEEGTATLTYAELINEVHRLAARLSEANVHRSDVVAVQMGRSISAVASILAIWSLGAAYLPLERRCPAARRRKILDEMKVSVLLADADVDRDLPRATTLLDPRERTAAPTAGATEEPHRHDHEALAYVIYTSGSTGDPLPVGVSHASLEHYVNAITPLLDPPPQIRWGLISTLSADLGHTALFPSLISGGVLNLLDEALAQDPERLAAYLEDHPLDILKIVPSHLEALLNVDRPERLIPRHRLVLGGEGLRWELVDRVKALAPECEILQHYGPTEATVGVIAGLVSDEAGRSGDQLAPLGRPLPGVTTRLEDETGEEVPAGETGELLLGGPTLAQGYIGRPDVTESRFTHRNGQRMYRTGDRVKALADGRFVFVGRVDNQVKIRGYRVDPLETENALRQSPEVRQAVVLPHEGRLAAWVVADSEPPVEPATLRAELAETLPDQFIPTSWRMVDRLPLTPNGKVDRSKLPAPVSVSDDEGGAEPATPTERKLAAIWSEVLKAPVVRRHDAFTDLGGDSLRVLLVITRAAKVGVKLTPQDILRHPKLMDLAACADQKQSKAARDVDEALPLSPTQHRFARISAPNPNHWVQARLLTVEQPLDKQTAHKIFGHLAAHHATLRLRAAYESGAWRQHVVKDADVPPLLEVDLKDAPDPKAAIDQAVDEVISCISLSKGPIWRIAWLNMPDGQPDHLIIAIHHLSVDVRSWQILLSDLNLLWDAALAGEALVLPPQSEPYLTWVRKLLQRDRSLEAPMWEKLCHSALASLPRDRDGDNTEDSLQQVSIKLDSELTTTLARRHPAGEIEKPLLCALGQALGEWTGAPAVLIDRATLGRDPSIAGLDVSRTVGWFAVRSPFALPTSVAEDAPTQLEHTLRATPNEGASYAILKHTTDNQELRARMSALPTPEIGWSWLGVIEDETSTGPLTVRKVSETVLRDPTAQRLRAMDVYGEIHHDQMHLHWFYSANLHDEATVSRLLDRMALALRTMASETT